MMKIKRSDIDAAIAVEVMGWDYPDRWGHWYVDGKPTEPHAFTPSTDLNHAFEALEKWLNDNPRMEFHSFTHSDVRPIMYEASLFCGESMVDFAEVDNESLATAICLALLQAVGVEA